MGETIKIAGADGFEFAAYHEPAFTPRKGGVIVIQEIFGIDKHVRADVERWAKMGYEAVAPSLYDRREPGFTAGHDPTGSRRASHAMGALTRRWATSPRRDSCDPRQVCVVGYCYGGSWPGSAGRSRHVRRVSYYGSLVKANAADAPCPVIIHLGRTDPSIPADEVAAAVAHHPNVPVYIYEGAHGFNNQSPERYNAEASGLGGKRTLGLFDKG